jgi:hypothetical protein
MFNRGPIEVHVRAPVHTEVEYVTREVHEHRAPTDASIALLNEMQAKARENIIDTIRIADNGFECVVQIDRDNMMDELRAVAAFSLNGRKLKASCTLSGREQPHDRVRLEVFEKLRGEVATVIAHELLASAWAQVVR